MDRSKPSGDVGLHRRLFLGTTAVTLLATLLGGIGLATGRLQLEGELPSFSGATTWLNSEPLTQEGLRGKVVLVEFWTYSCINWLRQLPYVRAWAEKYKDQGLVVIGVHSPEFGFEKEVGNVREAARDLRVDYPIAVDSDHEIWRAFDNRFWPALYFVDATGRIRHHRFGEGEYEQSERVIQQLLAEAGAMGVPTDLVAPDGRGAEAPPDWGNLRTPEIYLGYERATNFTSLEGFARDRPRIYSKPDGLRLNQWALSGDWTVGRQATALNEAGGRVAYSFHARDAHIVMGPATNENPIRFRVLLDGQPPGDSHGANVDSEGFGTASTRRLHQLIRQPGPVVARQVEIEFLGQGIEVFSLTFG